MLGNKFIPNFSLNKKQFFNFLLKNLDNNFIQFDNFLNISKSELSKKIFQKDSNKIVDSSDLLENEKEFNRIFREISKKSNKNLGKNVELA